jgi:hypothetical protein
MTWQTFALVLSTLVAMVWRRRRAEPSVDALPEPQQNMVAPKEWN